MPATPPAELAHPPPAAAAGNSGPSDQHGQDDRKTTDDGAIILEPQPDDSANDPLNWPTWRRDSALVCLGLYCMVGGGITPLIAAGFTDVAQEFDVPTERVALTTGLYMMGLGLGSVVFSPTAILWGKRPVYLFSSIIFIATSLWAGWSPSFNSLLIARIFQGVAVSPVECLPSATIAEIFFLHERAYRIGIYTLLLLGGKNLVPLVSAAIINSLGWRWVFWITAIIVGVFGVLLFFFVPETFWDRTPTRKPQKRPSFLRRLSSRHGGHTPRTPAPVAGPEASRPASPGAAERHKDLHVGFAPGVNQADASEKAPGSRPGAGQKHHVGFADSADAEKQAEAGREDHAQRDYPPEPLSPASPPPEIQHAHGSASPNASSGTSYAGYPGGPSINQEKLAAANFNAPPKVKAYTHNLKQQPHRSMTQQLKPFHGRLNGDKWFKVALRPFILFAYPAVLWSSVVYACSVGWLIVVSETLAIIFRDPTIYDFTALQTGLIYISPFVGGILGTAVAGKISDIIVKFMSRRNGGLYEPEFRLVMAIPITISTCIGLMGFGWSAQMQDHWIVPTLMFGIMSFGCSLGSTTSITFCVDSYRQYAGEALVTLNFSKNVLHGLVFSLFVTHWMEDEGPKMMFIWIGIIQLLLMLFSIPMYIYGKRARMWTVRMNLMEKF